MFQIFILYTWCLNKKNHYHWQQTIADPTSNCINKLKDWAINQVVNDLIMAKDSSRRTSCKQYNESVDTLDKCGINVTIDALFKRVEGD